MLTPVIVLGGLGLVMGAGLFFALKKFPPKFDPVKDAIDEVLPGVNCGGCGFPGCSGYASALADSKGKLGTTLCPVGGADVAKKIQEILGVEEAMPDPKVAVVLCAGTDDVAKRRASYVGEADCNIAAITGGGPKACTYGCMGFGSCVKACPFDAIVIIKGVAFVLPEKCTGCGSCIDACPKNIIKLFPANHKTHILCASKAGGKETKAACAVGCIACQQCVRLEPRIKMDGNIALVSVDEPFDTPAAALTCPQKSIVDLSAYTYEQWLTTARDEYGEKQKEWKAAEKKKKDEEKARLLAEKEAAEAAKAPEEEKAIEENKPKLG